MEKPEIYEERERQYQWDLAQAKELSVLRARIAQLEAALTHLRITAIRHPGWIGIVEEIDAALAQESGTEEPKRPVPDPWLGKPDPANALGYTGDMNMMRPDRK